MIASFLSTSTTPLLAPGGWLHLKDKVEQEGLDLGSFPDGRPIPEDYVFDTWYLIGEDGLAVQAVAVMYDLDGRQVQLSLFDGRTWENPTFGLRYAGEPFPLALDAGLGRAIRMGRNSDCAVAEAARSGRPTVEISFYEHFPGGLTLANYPDTLSRITWRGVFDAQTKALLAFEEVYTSQDGRERLVTVATVLATERVASPRNDLLSLLQGMSR